MLYYIYNSVLCQAKIVKRGIFSSLLLRRRVWPLHVAAGRNSRFGQPQSRYTAFLAAATMLSTVASAFARSAFASASAVGPFDSLPSLRAGEAAVRLHDLIKDAPAFAKGSAGKAERRDSRPFDVAQRDLEHGRNGRRRERAKRRSLRQADDPQPDSSPPAVAEESCYVAKSRYFAEWKLRRAGAGDSAQLTRPLISIMRQ